MPLVGLPSRTTEPVTDAMGVMAKTVSPMGSEPRCNVEPLLGYQS